MSEVTSEQGEVSTSSRDSGTLSVCPVCRTEFEGRPNKKTCSPACRKKSYRQGAAYQQGLREKVTRRTARKALHQVRRITFTPFVRGPQIVIERGSKTEPIKDVCVGGGQAGVPTAVPRQMPTLNEAKEIFERKGWDIEEILRLAELKRLKRKKEKQLKEQS